MRVAVSSASLAASTPAALARAAALGFTTVEVALLADEFDYGYRRKPNVAFYRRLREQLDGASVTAWSVTTPSLSQPQMFDGRARREILLGSVGAAAILGARVLVARPADIFTSEEDFETYWREGRAPPTIGGFDEAWAQAANRRITLSLTNHAHWLGAPLTNQAERLAAVTEHLAVGWAMDVAWALRAGDLDAWLAAVGERLVVAHLYELDRSRLRAPRAAAWAARLATLADTRLKGVVLRGGEDEPDEVWRAARDMVVAAFDGR